MLAELPYTVSLILKHAPQTLRIIVFGSFAREVRGIYPKENRRFGVQSDLDLLVKTPEPNEPFETWHTIYRFLKTRETSGIYKIHLVVCHGLQIGHNKLLSDIQRDGIVLFERERDSCLAFGIRQKKKFYKVDQLQRFVD